MVVVFFAARRKQLRNEDEREDDEDFRGWGGDTFPARERSAGVECLS
jgi:hypothetical protein